MNIVILVSLLSVLSWNITIICNRDMRGSLHP